jgi:uncharacterized membrane protein (DUF441 family)
MRSYRITRHIARILGATVASVALLGGVAAAPAHAAHGLSYTTQRAHGL